MTATGRKPRIIEEAIALALSDLQSLGPHARVAPIANDIRKPGYTLVTERLYHTGRVDDIFGILRKAKIEQRKANTGYGAFVSQPWSLQSKYSGDVQFEPEFGAGDTVLEFVLREEQEKRLDSLVPDKNAAWWYYPKGIDLSDATHKRVLVRYDEQLDKVKRVMHGIDIDVVPYSHLVSELMLQDRALAELKKDN